MKRQTDGISERTEKEAGRRRVRELFFILAFTEEPAGPGRCYEVWSQVGVSGYW